MVCQLKVWESRPGYIFTATIKKQWFSGKEIVRFYVDGKKESVGTIKIHPDSRYYGCRLEDSAFQKWVIEGHYKKTVKDHDLLLVLTNCQCERKKKVLWYRLTYRFLPTEDFKLNNPRFILTTDKSNLPEEYKRILEVGEDVANREKKEKEEARILYEKEKFEKEERLRVINSELIVSVATLAINENFVPIDIVKKLSKLGLLESSTSFRSGAAFPGESWIIWYDFTENEIQYKGYIGFYDDLKLCSVDERFPKKKKFIFVLKSWLNFISAFTNSTIFLARERLWSFFINL